MSSYVFAGRARTYRRVIKWMENPISVSARIMRFPLLSAGSVTFMFRNCCLSERDKGRETAGERKQNGAHWNDFLSWCFAPFLWKKTKNCTIILSEVLFFQNLIWNSRPYIRVFFCSQSLLSQLWCSRCFIIQTKLIKSLNLLFFQIGICTRPHEIINRSWRHSCSFMSCKIYTSVLKHSDCWPQTPAHFRHFQAQNWWTWLALDNRHFSRPEECKFWDTTPVRPSCVRNNKVWGPPRNSCCLKAPVAARRRHNKLFAAQVMSSRPRGWRRIKMSHCAVWLKERDCEVQWQLWSIPRDPPVSFICFYGLPR